VERNVEARRLHFTLDPAHIQEVSLCFIAVPTPSLPDGSCDLSYVLKAGRTIGEQMRGELIIVNKSTSPVGTTEQLRLKIEEILQQRRVSYPFEVVSNPEFLKEGCAVSDCLKPDRIILGTNSLAAAKVLREVYAAFTINHDRILVMDPPSAEMTKYAANAMLALRISFMNELAHLAEHVGANIKQVRLGIGSDQRIGPQFLYAGAGYGGSCFPKDVRALDALGRACGISMPIVQAIECTNERQKLRLGEKLSQIFSSLSGKKIALWGLSFKPDTDDIREAPSLVLIETLLSQGAHLQVYDPVVRSLPPHPHLHFCSDAYEAAQGTDAIVLITEWKQFRSVDFPRLLKGMRQPIFLDGRNQYDPLEMRAMGWNYFGIGIPSLGSYALSC
jgi:UDPglucose 6-dehydrogenase